MENKIVVEGCEFHEFMPDVQARVDALIAEAVMAEREACAKACEEWRAGCDNRTMQAEGWAAQECADAIRMRSN